MLVFCGMTVLSNNGVLYALVALVVLALVPFEAAVLAPTVDAGPFPFCFPFTAPAAVVFCEVTGTNCFVTGGATGAVSLLFSRNTFPD